MPSRPVRRSCQQLSLQVFNMWLTQAFQSRLANAFSKPEEPRLHVRRKGGDFCDNGFVQDFDAPSHTL